MAPNVTLALEVLRMPTLELRSFLEHQLEDNPLLEMDEEEEAALSAEQPADEAAESEPTNGLDEDWLSWRVSGERENPDPDEPSDDRIVDQRLINSQSLQESLELQLGCQPLSEEERSAGEVLIQHLDESGYLEGSLEEIAAETSVPVERLGALLGIIQHLDPPGVGARDLRECLMLQMEQRQMTETLAYHILTDHFPLFTRNEFGALARATGTTLEEIREACGTLRQLNPKPGRAFASDLPPWVVPDLVIRHQDKHYDVELNDQDTPRVTISRTYYRMLKDPRTPNDAKEFLIGKYRKASWLIKAIDERNTTLLSIARCLISLQRDFVEQGRRALKPLTQAQVAGLIGRHPSTVSRAITGKTIDTPYGVFRLEQLFASSVPQADRPEGVSDEQIKSDIQRLITEEDPQHPLSDAALVERLSQRNVLVARRTIAKYRTSLKVLPAHLRRHRL